MVSCIPKVGILHQLSLLVTRNGFWSVFWGFVGAILGSALFALEWLPGFTRMPWGGPKWSIWSLAGGFLATSAAFLWKPCRATTSEQMSLEEGEADKEPVEVNPYLGLASVTTFLTVLAAMVPVTVAPVEGTLLPIISYLLLTGCTCSLGNALALRRYFVVNGKDGFSHAWSVSVSSPLCWGFMDVAVSLFRAGWYDVAWEYSIYGGIIWLVVGPSVVGYFLWLVKTVPRGKDKLWELATLVLILALALPPVLAVCGCFLLARAWGPTPLTHAAIFSGMMLTGCLTPRLILAVRRARMGPAAEEAGKQADRQ